MQGESPDPSPKEKEASDISVVTPNLSSWVYFPTLHTPHQGSIDDAGGSEKVFKVGRQVDVSVSWIVEGS